MAPPTIIALKVGAVANKGGVVAENFGRALTHAILFYYSETPLSNVLIRHCYSIGLVIFSIAMVAIDHVYGLAKTAENIYT